VPEAWVGTSAAHDRVDRDLDGWLRRTPLGGEAPAPDQRGAAISPAIWTSYAQAKAANSGAYASAADFTRDDVITHTAALAGKPVRVVSGNYDPFHSGVIALAKTLPAPATVQFSKGCHSSPFFAAQQHPSLAFLGDHLTHD
jgi:hypothetical protein